MSTLGLYVHIPWCVRKCPYCDFNSHQLPQGLDEKAYVDALLADLAHDLPSVVGRQVTSIFIGGGTPSLFSSAAIRSLMNGLRDRISIAKDSEITLEANPGAVDEAHFAGYREAGINRLSIGAQSFAPHQLSQLGRIHQSSDIDRAFNSARAAGFDNINLDLMFGLPGQSVAQAMDDLARAIELSPNHLSWYQLGIEPNTWFHHQPPDLPDEDILADMQQAGQALLGSGGYQQYEVSAYAKPGNQCHHNLNYWKFGDYLGIGAGAHGKLSNADGQWRTARERHPETYMALATQPEVRKSWQLGEDDLAAEFMLNALRLTQGVPLSLFVERTGLGLNRIEDKIAHATKLGLLEDQPNWLLPTERGRWLLNDLIGVFL